MNPELNREFKDDKKSILDVRAVTIEGMQINIEIQLSNQYDIEKRSLYYWAKMYSRQMREGMAYKELAKAVTINILDFNYLNQTKNYSAERLPLVTVPRRFQVPLFYPKIRQSEGFA